MYYEDIIYHYTFSPASSQSDIPCSRNAEPSAVSCPFASFDLVEPPYAFVHRITTAHRVQIQSHAVVIGMVVRVVLKRLGEQWCCVRDHEMPVPVIGHRVHEERGHIPFGQFLARAAFRLITQYDSFSSNATGSRAHVRVPSA